MFIRRFPRQISLGVCMFALSNMHSPAQDSSLQSTNAARFDSVVGQTESGDIHNNNPNYAKIREYGRIEWHGSTAQLVVAGSRPLDMAALTLSSCLGISVSAEDPHYLWPGDLLDVTAPQWAANHPGEHVYAAKPGQVTVFFQVDRDGLPIDAAKLLEDAVDQVNHQQPWHFRVQHDVRHGRGFFAFVPTATHNESGRPEEINSWLDERMTIRPTSATIKVIANTLAENLRSETGYHFSCCTDLEFAPQWGKQTIHFAATDQTARSILEDLMIADGDASSYIQSCEPMDKRFCFISVKATVERVPPTAPHSGVCPALGYDPN